MLMKIVVLSEASCDNIERSIKRIAIHFTACCGYRWRSPREWLRSAKKTLAFAPPGFSQSEKNME
jgi:hypothetical protein